MTLVPADPTAPIQAGVWLITMATAQGAPVLGDDGTGLSPLGQVVTSIWHGMAFDAPGVAMGDLAVLPDRIRALLIVPWAGSALAVAAVIDHFKNLVANTAQRAGLPLGTALWRSDIDGRLIEDPIELAACRNTLRATR